MKVFLPDFAINPSKIIPLSTHKRSSIHNPYLANYNSPKLKPRKIQSSQNFSRRNSVQQILDSCNTTIQAMSFSPFRSERLEETKKHRKNNLEMSSRNKSRILHQKRDKKSSSEDKSLLLSSKAVGVKETSYFQAPFLITRKIKQVDLLRPETQTFNNSKSRSFNIRFSLPNQNSSSKTVREKKRENINFSEYRPWSPTKNESISIDDNIVK